MRFYQSRSLTALLALFNARLGAWIQNPRMTREEAIKRKHPQYQEKPWTAESPKFGGLLVTELFGKTMTRHGEYVHLSDGGHFENMGVYELIRRRCRYIVALDASDETTSSGSNLAILIRLCRIDFGIRIQIDTSPLQPQGPDRLTRTHVAIRPHPLRRRRPGAAPRRAGLREDLDDRRRAVRPPELREERFELPVPADRPPPVVRRGAIRVLPLPGRPHRHRGLRGRAANRASDGLARNGPNPRAAIRGIWSTSPCCLRRSRRDGRTRPSWRTSTSWNRPRLGSRFSTTSAPIRISPV